MSIRQFQGAWLPIAEADRTRLPRGSSSTGHFAVLGEGAVLGSRIFDIHSTVLICVGPLSYPAFRSLLPDGERADVLSDLAAIALGPDKAFRVRLDLRPAEVPALRLAGERDEPTASRLGWNTWLFSQHSRTDAVAAEFRPPSHLR